MTEMHMKRVPFESPLKYRTPAIPSPDHPRYEALTFRMGGFSAHVGSDRPRWLPVRAHRALLRIRMGRFIARSIWRDEWGHKTVFVHD